MALYSIDFINCAVTRGVVFCIHSVHCRFKGRNSCNTLIQTNFQPLFVCVCVCVCAFSYFKPTFNHYLRMCAFSYFKPTFNPHLHVCFLVLQANLQPLFAFVWLFMLKTNIQALFAFVCFLIGYRLHNYYFTVKAPNIVNVNFIAHNGF